MDPRAYTYADDILEGRIILITGASAGIGEATARAVAAEGASVVLGARRVDRLEDLAAELGSKAAVVEMDVREPADSQRLVAEARSRFGGLDALVANAGIGAYGGIMDLTDEKLKTMMDTNVAGTVWPIRAAVPGFVDQGGGDIVIVEGTARIETDAPSAADNPAYVEKYLPVMNDYGWTPEWFAGRYSVPIRIAPTRFRYW